MLLNPWNTLYQILCELISYPHINKYHLKRTLFLPTPCISLTFLTTTSSCTYKHPFPPLTVFSYLIIIIFLLLLLALLLWSGTIIAVHEKLNVLQTVFPSPHWPWNRLATSRRKERSLPWLMTWHDMIWISQQCILFLILFYEDDVDIVCLIAMPWLMTWRDMMWIS